MVNHGVSMRKLGRNTAHRISMLRTMVSQLLEHERIKTTLPRAKELRRVADKMVSLGKKGTLHSRRQAARVIRGTEAMRKLFGELAKRYKEREGGYVRVLHAGKRDSDSAQMAFIEFVDRPDLCMESCDECFRFEFRPRDSYQLQSKCLSCPKSGSILGFPQMGIKIDRSRTPSPSYQTKPYQHPMVRFKNRFLLIEIAWKHSSGCKEASPKILKPSIRKSIRFAYGEDADTKAAWKILRTMETSQQVKTLILRCSRSESKKIRRAIELMKEVGGWPVTTRVTKVSSAMERCQLTCS